MSRKANEKKEEKQEREDGHMVELWRTYKKLGFTTCEPNLHSNRFAAAGRSDRSANHFWHGGRSARLRRTGRGQSELKTSTVANEFRSTK